LGKLLEAPDVSLKNSGKLWEAPANSLRSFPQGFGKLLIQILRNKKQQEFYLFFGPLDFNF
jgi:hypothetical protein